MEDVLETTLFGPAAARLDLGTSTADPQLAESLGSVRRSGLVVSALSVRPKRSVTCCAVESPASSTRRTPETLAAAARRCSKPAAGRVQPNRGHRRRSPPAHICPRRRNASWCCTPRPQTRVGRPRGGSQPADRQDVREPHPGQIRTGGPAGSDEDRPHREAVRDGYLDAGGASETQD